MGAAQSWKYVALAAVGFMLTGLLTWTAGRMTAPEPLTEERVREIAAEGRIDTEELRSIIGDAMRTSFTKVSTEHGMYALEGRPRIEAFEDAMGRIAGDMKKIEEKLDQALTK